MGQQKNFFRFFVPFVLIVVAVAGAYLFWYENFSEVAKAKKEQVAYETAERRYIEAMTADTYGGKTPQETLDLFVAALKNGDLELASKYFALDDDLSKEKWQIFLTKIQEQSKLTEMINNLLTAQPYESINEDRQQLVIYNPTKTDSLLVNFRLNQYSDVWKIESL